MLVRFLRRQIAAFFNFVFIYSTFSSLPAPIKPRNRGRTIFGALGMNAFNLKLHP